MRIVIDCQALQTGSAYRGIGRYVRGLINGLVVKKNIRTELFLLINGSLRGSAYQIVREFKDLDVKFLFWYSANGNQVVSCSNSELNSELLYEAAVLSVKPDILLVGSVFEGISETFCLPLERLFRKIIIVSVFYDLIPYYDISNCSEQARFWYVRCLMRLQLSDLLLCISDYVKNEIQRLVTDIPTVNIRGGIDNAIFCNKSDIVKNNQLLSEIGVGGKYYLYVGGADDRKNIPFMIDAFADLIENKDIDCKLIIVAGRNLEKSLLLRRLVVKRKMKSRILVFTYLSDDKLAALYQNADLFIFPSLAEGLGFPILEAMALGVPVICSNTTSMPEVHGWDKGQFSPYDKEELKKLMLKVDRDKDFKEELKKHSLNQARNFTWSNTGSLVYSAINNLTIKNKQKQFGKRIEALVECASIRNQSDVDFLLMAQALAAQYYKRVYIDVTYVLSNPKLTDYFHFFEIISQITKKLPTEFEIVLFGLENDRFNMYERLESNWITKGEIDPKPGDIVLIDDRSVSYTSKRKSLVRWKECGVLIALLLHEQNFRTDGHVGYQKSNETQISWLKFISSIYENFSLLAFTTEGAVISVDENLWHNLENSWNDGTDLDAISTNLIALICVEDCIRFENISSSFEVLNSILQTMCSTISKASLQESHSSS